MLTRLKQLIFGNNPGREGTVQLSREAGNETADLLLSTLVIQLPGLSLLRHYGVQPGVDGLYRHDYQVYNGYGRKLAPTPTREELGQHIDALIDIAQQMKQWPRPVNTNAQHNLVIELCASTQLMAEILDGGA